jgi:chromosome segregation ATPase
MPEFPPRQVDPHDRTAHLRIDALERVVTALSEELGDMRQSVNDIGRNMAAVSTDISWIRETMTAQTEEISLLRRAINNHQTEFTNYRHTSMGSGAMAKSLGVISTLVALLAAVLGFNLL